MMRALFLLSGLLFLLLPACSPTTSDDPSSLASSVAFRPPAAPDLDAYWYQGKAELNRYVLEQNRYQDTHPGEVVMIFVTEDFRTDIQVKSEGGQPERSVNVLKTNMIRRFTTGLYDYSIMTSVFTPVEGPERRTMKVTMSSQDWCGQSFMQLNLQEEEYRVQLRSYFESEGDQNGQVGAAWLEDELFNRIRIQPSALPVGKFLLLPSTTFTRLKHLPFEPVMVIGEMTSYAGERFEGEELLQYRIEMPALKRELSIVFENQAPYRIAGWTDRYPSAFDGQQRTTVARLDERILSAYWQKNDLEETGLRSQLGLRPVGER